MYHIGFMDHEGVYATIVEARRSAIQEMRRHDFYTMIEIYPSKGAVRPSGYVRTNGLGFYYVTYSGGKRIVKRLNTDGTVRM